MDDISLKAKLLCTFGWRLALCGAETRLIIQSVKTMAYHLGINNIELGFNRTGITVKITSGSLQHIEFKEIKNFGINMYSLTKLNHISHMVSQGKLTDVHQIYHAIRAVRPRHYNMWLLVLIESIAGGCFAFLNGGNPSVMLAAFCGGAVLMYVRFNLIKRKFFESFVFMCAAFCGSTVALFITKYILFLRQEDISLTLMATCLILVPGFPFMNGFLDVFKGYIDVGISRISISIILTASAAVGLVGSFYLLSLPIFEKLL